MDDIGGKGLSHNTVTFIGGVCLVCHRLITMFGLSSACHDVVLFIALLYGGN